MFFKQILRNSAKNRKSNGLFFGSLVIAIIAFYTLLSLKSQDVMIFLSTMESDAIRKLMLMIPAVYIVSLFFVFFLVYFACSYQMTQRRREFGLYLMLGMKRGRLFLLLLCEILWSSLISLLIGLPLSLLLTEGISLATAQLVGLGIIGHHLTLSLPALLWTILGFLAVQLLSMLLICLKYCRTEPGHFLRSDAPMKQRSSTPRMQLLCFCLGILFLAGAYVLGIGFLRSLSLKVLLAILLLGFSGTFLLYRGLGGLIGSLIKRKSPGSTGLYTFTGRQLQEDVFSEHKALAISSLLLLMALSCISFGLSVSMLRSGAKRSVDFSVNGTASEFEQLLSDPDTAAMIDFSYPMYVESIFAFMDEDSIASLLDALRRQPQSDLRDNMLQYAPSLCDYALPVSSYNQLLASMGKEPIELGEDHAAFYTSMGDSTAFLDVLGGALEDGALVTIKNNTYELLPTLYHDNIVADRAITLDGALILPDELYWQLMTEKNISFQKEYDLPSEDTDLKQEPFCWNIRLSKKLFDELGLMQAIQKMDAVLYSSGLTYESYLKGIGRNLFYTVAASYLTVYLGVLFLIIANTVIGLKYLTSQQKNKQRYITLLMLGAKTGDLCRSSGRQISHFFSLVLIVALCNSVAAVITMFTSFTHLPAGSSMAHVLFLAAIVLILFALAELFYIKLVKRNSFRELRSLRITDRG